MDEQTAIDTIRSVSPDANISPEYLYENLNPTLDLSIIVPVYNHVDEIHLCIDSIINQQTRFSYEIILIDDGSTDGAQYLIDKYTIYPNVKVYHQSNKGIAAARNEGIVHSRGKYLMFVDCDDIVKPYLVEKLMEIADTNDSDIVMGAHNLVKMKEGSIVDIIPQIEPEINLLGYKNGDVIMNYAGLPWAKVYKRELFDDVRFFPGYWYEDTIIHSLVFLKCKKFSYVTSLVYDYIWNERNFSHTQDNKNHGKPKTADRYWLLSAITKHYEEIGLPLDAKFYTMILKHISAYYYKTISAMPDDFITAMFVAGRALLLKYRPAEKVKLPYMLRQTEKAIISRDISHWKLCSLNQ